MNSKFNPTQIKDKVGTNFSNFQQWPRVQGMACLHCMLNSGVMCTNDLYTNAIKLLSVVRWE